MSKLIGLVGTFSIFAISMAPAHACDFEHARYSYTGTSAMQADFVRLPSSTHLMSRLAMRILVNEKPVYNFVFDSGSRRTVMALPVIGDGPDAWNPEIAPKGLQAMDFHQWTGDVLSDRVPDVGRHAEETLFIPALDESMRHLPNAPIAPSTGFFKLKSCKG